MKKLKTIFCLGLLLVLVGSACAQSSVDATTSDNTFVSRLWDVVTGKASPVDFAIYSILPMLAGGVLTFAVVLVLQRLGFDVIGITFNFLFFIFDLFFSLFRFALASEGNLVALVILFIALWMFILLL